MALTDGFLGERFEVVPRPAVAQALSLPVTRRLVVTDAGYFPLARDHARQRPEGASESILIVCTSGRGTVVVEGVESTVTSGDAVVIASRAAHSYRADPRDPWTIWWCHVRGTDVEELIAAAGADRSPPVLALRQPERAVALIDEIISHLEAGTGPAPRLAAAGAAWKLLTQLAVDQMLPGRGDPVERAMAFIAERVDAPLRVDQLAALVGVSPSHLGALFRQATGGGILAHQTSVRMARARGLLDRTTLSISEIARAVGYDDPLYFSRQFRARHGQSPRQYRSISKG